MTLLKLSHKLIFCVVDEKKWKITKFHGCIFLSEKRKRINPFLLLTRFFSFLIDNFGDTRQISCGRQKVIDEKSPQLHFASSVNSLTQSHNCEKKFSSQWGLLDNWWNGARRLLAVEKGASTFQAADLATSVPLTCLQNYIASKTNHCFKSFGKNISLLLYWIHKVKM